MTFYDTPIDVVRKAARGQAIDLATLADPPGNEGLADWLRSAGERIPPQLADRIAPPLGLDARALATFPDSPGELPLPDAIRRLELPFDDETVNAWLVQLGGRNLVIDAGRRRDDLAAALDPLDVATIDLLITHPHRDHIGGLERVRPRLASLHAPVDSGIPDARGVVAGGTIRIGGPGGLELDCFDLAGHHPHSLGWRFDLPGGPAVVAVGDALFAASMGGCPDRRAYFQAQRGVRRHLLTLPGETILLTGHGAATTVDRELERNPFFANGAEPAGFSAADASP